MGLFKKKKKTSRNEYRITTFEKAKEESTKDLRLLQNILKNK